MNVLLRLLVVLGFGCLVIGLIASLSGGGTLEQVMALGRALVIAGAIIISGVLISSAITGRDKE